MVSTVTGSNKPRHITLHGALETMYIKKNTLAYVLRQLKAITVELKSGKVDNKEIARSIDDAVMDLVTNAQA